MKEQLDGNEAKIEELKTLLARLTYNEAAHNSSSNGKGETEKGAQPEGDSSLSKLPKVECLLTDVRRSDANIKVGMALLFVLNNIQFNNCCNLFLN